jgi:hypothetical protein
MTALSANKLGAASVGVTTRCLRIAALDSVIVSNFVSFLNIAVQASVISISRVKMGSGPRIRGMVFRYFVVDTAIRYITYASSAIIWIRAPASAGKAGSLY